MQSVKELNKTQMQQISGGGNVVDCLSGAGIGLGAIGLTLSGPVGWGMAAAAGGFVTGYSCTSAFIKGD